MDESLTERRRVRDEGPRVVNRCQLGGNLWGFSPVVDRFSEEGRAKFRASSRGKTNRPNVIRYHWA